MTVYATQSDVENAISVAALAMIADHDGNGTTDAAVVGRALSEASSLADGYLTAHLPISPVPDILRRVVVDIAVEHLREAREQSTEDSRRRYEAAMDWLKDVGKGLVTFTPEEPASDPGDPEVDTDSAPRLFTRATGSRFL